MLEETGRKENPPTLLMRIEFSKIIMENSMEVLKKNRNRITIRSNNPDSGRTPEKMESRDANSCSYVIYKNQEVEVPRCSSVDEWRNKM